MSERRVSEVPKLDIYTRGDRHEQPSKQDAPLDPMREKSGDESTSDVTEAL